MKATYWLFGPALLCCVLLAGGCGDSGTPPPATPTIVGANTPTPTNTPTSTPQAPTWTSRGPLGGVVQALAVDPDAPQTLYAGTYGGGVFKSTDGAGNWMAMNNGLSTTDVRALILDPSAPQTLYAGTAGGGVFKSTDGAASWAAIKSGLSNNAVLPLALDPSVPQTLYAGTFGGGVFSVPVE